MSKEFNPITFSQQTSKAIEELTSYISPEAWDNKRTIYSCIQLSWTEKRLPGLWYTDFPIVKQYSEFSEARELGGFKGMHEDDEGIYNYRLEMLYYFWQFNFSMDA